MPKIILEQISQETTARLRELQSQIDEHMAQVALLKKEVDSLVPKHTFEECRAAGCVHTARCRFYCSEHEYCVRSNLSRGATRDYFKAKTPVIKERVTYPTLGWNSVAARGLFYGGTWHGSRKVIKETPKTLVLDDNSVLLKSTMFNIEDVTYIKSKPGTTYFCADTPELLDASDMLLKVRDSEIADGIKMTRLEMEKMFG